MLGTREDIMSGVQPQPIGLSPEDRDALQALTDKLVSLSFGL